MKYPNAANGVRKIFISEIIALSASVITVIVAVFAEAYIEDSRMSIEFGVISIIMLLIIAIYIAAYILQIVGIVRAGRDEPAFKVSLYSIIAELIITVLSGFFYQNEAANMILGIAGDVAQFFLVHYIIHGIMHIADHMGKPEMTQKGKRIFIVIYTAIAFEIVVRIFEIIYGHERGESLSLPFGIVANVLKTVENILFLIYIGKGNKILHEKKQHNSMDIKENKL